MTIQVWFCDSGSESTNESEKLKVLTCLVGDQDFPILRRKAHASLTWKFWRFLGDSNTKTHHWGHSSTCAAHMIEKNVSISVGSLRDRQYFHVGNAWIACCCHCVILCHLFGRFYGNCLKENLIAQALGDVIKAWSPSSRKDRRTCLRRWFKEDFKAVRISIEKVSCEISQLVIITRIRRPSHIYTA